MREQYLEMLEEAVAASANREDFDEMLLRVTKRHLPVKYHTHFIAMLDEILKEAEEKGMTNRQAAMEILKGAKGPGTSHPAAHYETLLRKAPPSGHPDLPPVAQTIPARPKEDKRPAAATQAHPVENEAAADDGHASSPVDENAAEAPKILDLGGMKPETLPPEVKVKLTKIVKARKQKAEWDDDSGGDVDPRIFFKGSQRCPPQIPVKPQKAEPGKDGTGSVKDEETGAPKKGDTGPVGTDGAERPGERRDRTEEE